MFETVEFWSNGAWGWNLRRIQLQVDAEGHWYLWAWWWKFEGRFRCADERHARDWLAVLLDPAYGPWNRLRIAETVTPGG